MAYIVDPVSGDISYVVFGGGGFATERDAQLAAAEAGHPQWQYLLQGQQTTSEPTQLSFQDLLVQAGVTNADVRVSDDGQAYIVNAGGTQGVYNKQAWDELAAAGSNVDNYAPSLKTLSDHLGGSFGSNTSTPTTTTASSNYRYNTVDDYVADTFGDVDYYIFRKPDGNLSIRLDKDHSNAYGLDTNWLTSNVQGFDANSYTETSGMEALLAKQGITDATVTSDAGGYTVTKGDGSTATYTKDDWDNLLDEGYTGINWAGSLQTLSDTLTANQVAAQENAEQISTDTQTQLANRDFTIATAQAPTYTEGRDDIEAAQNYASGVLQGTAALPVAETTTVSAAPAVSSTDSSVSEQGTISAPTIKTSDLGITQPTIGAGTDASVQNQFGTASSYKPTVTEVEETQVTTTPTIPVDLKESINLEDQQTTHTDVEAADASKLSTEGTEAQHTAAVLGEQDFAKAQTLENLSPDSLATAATLETSDIPDNALATAVQRTVDVKETVRGQLDILFADSPNGETPIWAKPAVNKVENMLATRGFSNSTTARDALYSAIISSAMPIAAADAATHKSARDITAANEQQVRLFNAAMYGDITKLNLSNKQAVALQNAQNYADLDKLNLSNQQQTDLANMAAKLDLAKLNAQLETNTAISNANFAREQWITQLNNEQQTILFNATQAANMDMANADRRTQVAMENAKNLLALEMHTMDLTQQAEIFNAQQKQQALLSNQAAQNAAANFEASSQLQIDTTLSNLYTQVAMDNARRADTMAITEAELKLQASIAEQGNTLQARTAQAQIDAQIKQTYEQLKFQRESFNAENLTELSKFNANLALEVSKTNAQMQLQANIANAEIASSARNASLDFISAELSDMADYYSTLESARISALAGVEKSQIAAIASLQSSAMTAGVGKESDLWTLVGQFFASGED